MTPSGKVWPWAMGTVLGLTVAGNLWVMRIAGSDRSFAVEPDYYKKAVAWDSTMAERDRNTALGWRLVVVGMSFAEDGAATLTVQLRDRGELPLAGASIQVAATHNAEAGRIVTGTLAEVTGGQYLGRLSARRPGIWELRFSVERGGERFTARVRHDTERDAPVQ
jgi:nitrogen fixation protein FixH